MLCWEIWQIFSANAFMIGKRRYEKVRLRLMRNLTFYFFICLISKVYFAANTNSPVMSLKNTLYLPAGTMMLSPPFVPVP